MGTMASKMTSLTIVYSAVYSSADQRKHQSSASLAFVRGIHRRPVNSPHKWPVTRKMFPFHDVIMVPNTTRTTGRKAGKTPTDYANWDGKLDTDEAIGNKLTHLPLNKMAAFSQTIFSDTSSWMIFFFILIKISLMFVHKGPIDNIPAPVQKMGWRRICEKPLSEPMMTLFDDAYMRHILFKEGPKREYSCCPFY